MARVTTGEVEAILDTDIDATSLLALIDDASAWVDAHLTDDLSEAVCTVIEKYLTAHLAVLSEEGAGQLVQSARDDVSERYAERKEQQGATSFIRTAAAYDTTGKVREHWMGGVRMRYKVGAGYT